MQTRYYETADESFLEDCFSVHNLVIFPVNPVSSQNKPNVWWEGEAENRANTITEE